MPEIHRWRAVVDFYAPELDPDGLERLHELVRAQFTEWFPCGVVEGYPDVYDQDEKRAKIETPFD